MRQGMTESPAPSKPLSIRFADRMHAEYCTLAGNLEQAQASIDRMAADTAAGRTSRVPLAMVYAVIGKSGPALDLLEEAVQHKDRQMLYVKVLPQFDRIHAEKRFNSIIQKMGL